MSEGKEIRLRLGGSPTRHCNFSNKGTFGHVWNPWQILRKGGRARILQGRGVSMVLEFGVLPTGGGASGEQPGGGGCICWVAASGQLCCQPTQPTLLPAHQKHGLLMMSPCSCHGSVVQGTVVGVPFPREGEPALSPHGLPYTPLLIAV